MLRKLLLGRRLCDCGHHWSKMRLRCSGAGTSAEWRLLSSHCLLRSMDCLLLLLLVLLRRRDSTCTRGRVEAWGRTACGVGPTARRRGRSDRALLKGRWRIGDLRILIVSVRRLLCDDGAGNGRRLSAGHNVGRSRRGTWGSWCRTVRYQGAVDLR